MPAWVRACLHSLLSFELLSSVWWFGLPQIRSSPWCPPRGGFEGGKCPCRWLSVTKVNLIEEGSLCPLPHIHLPQMYLAFFFLILMKSHILFSSHTRCSSLPAHSAVWLWERRWDGGVEQFGAQYHLCFLLLWVGVMPHLESKESSGNRDALPCFSNF